MAGFIVENALRPCKVKFRIPDEKKPYTFKKEPEIKNALFHTWAHESSVVPESPLAGGHKGGVVSYTVGIVEFEDGTVHMLSPECITFIDDKHQEYSFPGEEGSKIDG